MWIRGGLCSCGC
uniref:Uncharacterized protein n=1 Tax=Anguilla anguilla TaxID=7936 RepID=A0A0E9TG88_ANGAN